MTPRRWLRSMALATAITSVGLADEVVLVPNATMKVPGGRVRGQITAETPAAVTVTPGSGNAQTIPIDQIDSITYDGQPPTMLLAQTSENAGNYPEAVDRYKKAATDAAGKAPIVRAAQFGAVRSQAQLALAAPTKAADAIAALEAFTKANPKSRFQGEALELLVKLNLSKGDADRAGQAADELAAIPWAADQATILKTRVMAKKGQHDQAIAALDKIIGEAPKGSPRLIAARLAQAESLSAAGKAKEAEATVKAVIKELPPENAELQAVANNTLGDCARAGNRPREALLAYLRTDILYDKNKEQHAKSLYEASRLWRELKRDDRADETLERLRRLYPQSPYAARR